MATIRKIERKSGARYKAIIKDKLGQALTSKTFTRKADACAWAKRIESDQEAIVALGTRGARMTFNELAKEYAIEWRGKDNNQFYRVRFWCGVFGNHRIQDITSDHIRQALKSFQQGDCLRGNGGLGKTDPHHQKRTDQ